MRNAQLRRRVVVHGLVQGVFFRDTCRREASRRDVRGWVRNQDDGTVEAVFEGSAEDVGAMVEWSGKGPPHAHVQRVDVFEEPVEGLTGFVIRHG
jgi:acylphosphatase